MTLMAVLVAAVSLFAVAAFANDARFRFVVDESALRDKSGE